jgi:hypothetical protein
MAIAPALVALVLVVREEVVDRAVDKAGERGQWRPEECQLLPRLSDFAPEQFP